MEKKLFCKSVKDFVSLESIGLPKEYDDVMDGWIEKNGLKESRQEMLARVVEDVRTTLWSDHEENASTGDYIVSMIEEAVVDLFIWAGDEDEDCPFSDEQVTDIAKSLSCAGFFRPSFHQFSLITSTILGAAHDPCTLALLIYDEYETLPDEVDITKVNSVLQKYLLPQQYKLLEWLWKGPYFLSYKENKNKYGLFECSRVLARERTAEGLDIELPVSKQQLDDIIAADCAIRVVIEMPSFRRELLEVMRGAASE